MEELLPELLRARVSRPAMSLREACQRAGLDKGGLRCVDCRLRELCFDETRWLVQRVREPRMPFPS